MAYDRRAVEALLPAVWDDAFMVHGIVTEERRDPEMPGSKPDPTKLNTHLAAIADMRTAWKKAELTRRERQVLLLAYGMDMPRKEVGPVLKIARATVYRDLDAGVGRLVAWLNGKDYYDMEEAA